MRQVIQQLFQHELVMHLQVPLKSPLQLRDLRTELAPRQFGQSIRVPLALNVQPNDC